MANNTKGFTLVEVLMSVMIMSIMAGIMTLSYHSTEQTPKREAEKVAAYITRLTQKSDRIKIGFDIEIQNARSLNVSWKKNEGYTEPPFEISAGLNVKWDDNHSNNFIYDYIKFPNGVQISAISTPLTEYPKNHRYIEITSENSSAYYVLITAEDKE